MQATSDCKLPGLGARSISPLPFSISLRISISKVNEPLQEAGFIEPGHGIEYRSSDEMINDGKVFQEEDKRDLKIPNQISSQIVIVFKKRLDFRLTLCHLIADDRWDCQPQETLMRIGRFSEHIAWIASNI